ncbi:tetratricopeptide repeat-containing sulfotransferase family protein [Maritimibacter sp. HL-12]|uniref:tetratricopeptide repeat-containing sulfotransferase family protein n=1 Tax=Maritimibacter sp. HL-12 TaxID=1162418 RepID=UPI000A0EF3D8|nr:tetratricopeptide repeat-containing sulfotransferase family protein [Maritimibacter sp. HL-12]SMH56391.1 Tetratricopeptide repeat-containing protein [Maritimibacter sp. HL-12]
MSVDATLRKAAKLAKQGDRGGAAALYREVLAKFPGNATARKGLEALATAQAGRPGATPGAARQAAAPRAPGPAPQQMQALQRLMQRGDIASVLAEGQRLALLFPKDPAILNLLALAQMRAGRLDAAIAGFDRVSALDPGFAGAHANRATALAQMGRHHDAEAAARAALKLDPNMVQAQLILGYALVNTERADAALACFEQAVARAPKLVQAQIGLGNARAALGQAQRALDAFEAAQALEPGNIDVLNNIGNALNALGRVDEAVEALGRAAALKPELAVLHSNHARALGDVGRSEEALAACEAALARDPKDAKTWNLLGNMHRELGDKARAIEAYDKALALDPATPEPLAMRWQIDTLPLDHPDFARMEALFDDPAVSPGQRTIIGFTLFKALDKAGDEAAAFARLDRANRMRRKAEPYDIEAHLAMFAAMKAQFAGGIAPLDTAALAEVPAPHRPLFIVGMPRSGTSLVEQILASHSQVHGAGELPAIGTGMARLGWRDAEIGAPPDRDTLMALRRDYFGALGRLGAGKPVITDKTPLNFRHLGHALAAMPEARVLFMRRDARATCWSNYSNSFVGSSNNFGNDMEDTAAMYLAHLDLMAFWASLYPDRIATVPYERLTEHQEEETRKLLAAAGLDWEDTCLDFHRTKRAVRTVSASQVREKMYTGSSEAWRRYEPFLGPMLDKLAGVV